MNRILLLEDDVSLIDGLIYSLKKNGFDVEVARTVNQAIQHLTELSKYDLLILDVTLPDGTGFDVCERVRKQNQQIPIIFLTASQLLSSETLFNLSPSTSLIFKTVNPFGSTSLLVVIINF